MRVLVFADTIHGAKIVEYLAKQPEGIIGVVLHREDEQRSSREIIEYSKLPKDRIFVSTKMKDKWFVKTVYDLKPDIVVCAYWGYILPNEIIKIPSKGCINVHLGFLPYNRGKNPNVWPIVEGTPAGVTVHYIDEEIDSGNIIKQKTVSLEPVDTGKTFYKKLTASMHEVFIKAWNDIKNDEVTSKKQLLKKGTFHLAKDFGKLDEIDLHSPTTALQVINHLRAKTFAPYPQAYFMLGGRKVGVRVELEYLD